MLLRWDEWIMKIDVTTKIDLNDETALVFDGIKDGYRSIDRKYTCLFDGTITNARELSKKLKKGGVYLKGSGDAELIIELFRFSGSDGWNELEGHFAFVIFNHKTNKLTAVCDRYGSKQLYYQLIDDGIRLFSTLNILKDDPTETPTFYNKDALFHYFDFGFIPGELTAHADIYHVPAGSVLSYDIALGVLIKPFTPLFTIHGSEQSLVPTNHLREVIIDSIHQRIKNTESIGLYFDGSYEQGILAGILKYASPHLKIFSLQFEGQEKESVKRISSIATEMEIPFIKRTISAKDYFDAAKESLLLTATPISDVNMPLTMLFSQMAVKHVDTIITTNGSLELFGGTLYKKRKKFDGISYSKNNTKLRLLKLSKKLPNRFKHVKSTIFERVTPPVNHYPGNGNIIALEGGYDYLKWTGPNWQTITKPIYNQIKDLNWLEQRQTLDFNIGLKRNALIQSEVILGHSLQVIHPFLDQKVIKVATDLTVDEKLGSPKQRPLLYEAFKNDVPLELFKNKHQQINVPLSDWIRKELFYDIHDLFNHRVAKYWFDVELINDLLLKHRKKRGDFTKEIWSITVFLLWIKQR